MPEEKAIQLVQMTQNVLPDVASLHTRAFSGYMNVQLGRYYIHSFFRWFIKNCHTSRSIAIVALAEDNRPAGYVVGAPIAVYSGLSRFLLLPGALGLLRRPSMLASGSVRRAIAERLRSTLRAKPTPKATSSLLPSPAASLVAIAVSPDLQGRGIGHLLMAAFEKEASNLGMAAMRLTVYENNRAACVLYEQCGWQILGSSTGSKGDSIQYFKKIA